MIYRAELPRLIRFLAFHGASPADAADAAQDALIKVYQRLDRVRTMKAPGAYLRKIALNEWKRLRDVPVADRDHEGYPKLSLKKRSPIAARNDDLKVFNGRR